MWPDSWQIVPLTKEVELISGQHILAKDYSTANTGIPYLTGPADFTDGAINVSKFTLSPKSMCKAGDILITVKGSGTGKMVVANDAYCISRQLMAIRPKTWNPMFLFFALSLRSERFCKDAVGLIPGITRDDILNAEILVPPLTEQRKIAQILGAWDRAIALVTRQIAAQQQRKQGLMQQLLTGKVRFAEFHGSGKRKQTELGWIPEEWEVKKLGEICLKFKNGGTPSTQKKEYWEGNIPWITGADFESQQIKTIRRKITPEAIKQSATNVIEKGNLLVVTRTGVGKLAIAPFDLAISQDITGVYVDSLKVSPLFLFYYLDFSSKKFVLKNQGTSINGITRAILVNHLIHLPPLPEQRKIAAVLSACDREIGLLQRQLACFKEQKKGLMQQLLTGQVRVKV
jgi:type I restriction enzyme S subunit